MALHTFDEVPKGGIYPEAELVKIEDILDKKIVIMEMTELEGDYGKYLVVKARIGKKLISFTTGGKVLMRKLFYAKEKNLLPIEGKIVKVKGKRYYDII